MSWSVWGPIIDKCILGADIYTLVSGYIPTPMPTPKCKTMLQGILMWLHPVLQEREGVCMVTLIQPLVAQEFHLLALVIRLLVQTDKSDFTVVSQIVNSEYTELSLVPHCTCTEWCNCCKRSYQTPSLCCRMGCGHVRLAKGWTGLTVTVM